MQERHCIERLIVVAQIFQSAALVSFRQALTDDVSKMLLERMLIDIKPIADAGSLNQLRRIMGKLVLDFAPVNALISARLVSYAVEEGRTATGVVSDISDKVWVGFANHATDVFSKTDRLTLMKAMRALSEVTELGEKTPPENMPALYSATVDGYWALLKIQLGIIAAAIIQSGELKPKDHRVPHWICVALRGYLSEWQSALFGNNPVLQERLSHPLESLNTITTEEMERRLGL
jgi:hypothetical protein